MNLNMVNGKIFSQVTTGKGIMAFIMVLLPVFQVWAGEYKIHDNGTVTDSSTGLIWQQQGDGAGRSWEKALGYCQNLRLAGHDDWRLPNVKELESLTKDDRHTPAIDQKAFPNTKTAGYWSSTTLGYNPDFAWFVYFNNGYVNPVNKPHEYYARCVRGGL